MRRRLDLAASLVGRPRFLYLDEPTTGLDPRSRLELWGMIRTLVADGTTVLLTTQYLEEADRLADEIVVIDRGRVIAAGTPQQLKTRVGGQVLQARPADAADLPATEKILAGFADGDEASSTTGSSLRSDRRPLRDRPGVPASRRRGHRGRRPVAAPPEPRRGVPRPHRPPRRGRRADDEVERRGRRQREEAERHDARRRSTPGADT